MRMLLVLRNLQQAVRKTGDRIRARYPDRVLKLNQTDERTDADGHGREAHSSY